MRSVNSGSIGRRVARVRSKAIWCGFVRAITLVISITQIQADASETETIEARYHRAISGINQFRSNMNGHWFGFTSEHRQNLTGTPQVRECRGVIYYSESQIYTAYLNFSTTSETPPGQTQLTMQTEAIVEDDLVVWVNNLLLPTTIRVSRSSSMDFVSDRFHHSRLSDVTRLFQQRIINFATQDFARPRLISSGQLVVRSQMGEAIKTPGSSEPSNNRFFDVIFSNDSEMRPIDNRILKLQSNGETLQLGFVDVRYGKLSNGKTVIRRIISESREDEPDSVPEIHDIQIREIECPDWNTTPAHFCIPATSFSVFEADMNGRFQPLLQELPGDADQMFRRIEENDWEKYIAAQRKTLDSMDAFVRAEVVSSETALEPQTAPQVASQAFPNTSVVAALLGFIIAVLVVIWIVLWKRAYSRRQ